MQIAVLSMNQLFACKKATTLFAAPATAVEPWIYKRLILLFVFAFT